MHCCMILVGFAHLFHAHDIAVVIVAVLADRNLEIELVVALVRLARRRSQCTPVERSITPDMPQHLGFGAIDHADIDIALLEDAVFGQQAFDIVQHLGEVLAEFVDVLEQGRAACPDARRRDGNRRHACALPLSALIEHHQLLALFEAPERRRQRAHIHRLGGDIEEMVEDAADLGIEHADILAALGHFQAQQLLDRQAEGVLLVHRRDIVEPVEIGDRLQIGLVLDQLLGAAMEQADMRIDARDDLAVQIQDQAQARHAPPDAAARN